MVADRRYVTSDPIPTQSVAAGIPSESFDQGYGQNYNQEDGSEDQVAKPVNPSADRGRRIKLEDEPI